MSDLHRKYTPCAADFGPASVLRGHSQGAVRVQKEVADLPHRADCRRWQSRRCMFSFRFIHGDASRMGAGRGWSEHRWHFDRHRPASRSNRYGTQPSVSRTQAATHPHKTACAASQVQQRRMAGTARTPSTWHRTSCLTILSSAASLTKAHICPEFVAL